MRANVAYKWTQADVDAYLSRPKRRSDTAPALPKITERQWQEQVEQLAGLFGYRFYHTWNSIKSNPGFPDLVLLKPPRLIFAELKVDGKKPTRDQQAWLDEVRATGVESYTWYPADLEQVKEVLR